MSVKIAKISKFLKEKYSGIDFNGGVKFPIEGLMMLYIDGILYDLESDNLLKSDNIKFIENFITYSVKKSKKQE